MSAEPISPAVAAEARRLILWAAGRHVNDLCLYTKPETPERRRMADTWKALADAANLLDPDSADEDDRAEAIARIADLEGSNG